MSLNVLKYTGKLTLNYRISYIKIYIIMILIQNWKFHQILLIKTAEH